jgi:hypothetical protein
MTEVGRSLSATRDCMHTGFWRVAAATTGFAVHHPRTMRVLPVGLVAFAAFALGRAAGQILTVYL